MAPPVWNREGPLLAGPVRVYKDNEAEHFVIETTKFNPAGSGLEICRLEFGRSADARVLLAFGDLLKAAEPFAELGHRLDLANADSEAPLLTNAALNMVVTVGDVQRIMAACAKVYPPVVEIPPGARLKRGSGRSLKPKGRKF
jgi:hypothetical protein